METKEYWQEGVDSKEYLVRFWFQLMRLMIIGVAGALIGSGLYLLIVLFGINGPDYELQAEYYIDFAEGRLEAKDFYNDYTWNSVIRNDLILGKAMNQLSGYERETVSDMLEANIKSDVRYLTVVVRGDDVTSVEEVSLAIGDALEAYPDQKDEFDRIYQVKTNDVQKIREPIFALRVASLGFVVSFLIGWFCFTLRFIVADAFYTRLNVERYLHLSALELRYRDGKKTKQKDIEIEDRENGIIILIPFGVECRRKVEDMLLDMNRQEKEILGVILTEVDAKWMKLYFGIRGGK